MKSSIWRSRPTWLSEMKACTRRPDLVVRRTRGRFTRVELTLPEGGRTAAVIQQRMEFQEVMRDRFIAVIETATGRRAVGFISGDQQDPDMICEVFVPAATAPLPGEDVMSADGPDAA
jgi:hypothetical protein